MTKLNTQWLPSAFRQEVPTGVVDGVNTDFVLSFAPLYPQSLKVTLNGLIVPQEAGALGYTLNDSTITFGTAPSIGQRVYAEYWIKTN